MRLRGSLNLKISSNVAFLKLSVALSDFMLENLIRSIPQLAGFCGWTTPLLQLCYLPSGL